MEEIPGNRRTVFRNSGFKAEVEKTIEGARTKHRIDVWVTGEMHGISFRWVVECKSWQSNIPKEKVMSLLAIVQDLGANHGFLLSEVGFQSGAIHAVRNTNITLASVADLQEDAKDSLLDATVSSLQWKISRYQHELRLLHKQPGGYVPEYARPVGDLFTLGFAFEDALRNKSPTVYGASENGDRFIATN